MEELQEGPRGFLPGDGYASYLCLRFLGTRYPATPVPRVGCLLSPTCHKQFKILCSRFVAHNTIYYNYMESFSTSCGTDISMTTTMRLTPRVRPWSHPDRCRLWALGSRCVPREVPRYFIRTHLSCYESEDSSNFGTSFLFVALCRVVSPNFV